MRPQFDPPNSRFEQLINYWIGFVLVGGGLFVTLAFDVRQTFSAERYRVVGYDGTCNLVVRVSGAGKHELCTNRMSSGRVVTAFDDGGRLALVSHHWLLEAVFAVVLVALTLSVWRFRQRPWIGTPWE